VVVIRGLRGQAQMGEVRVVGIRVEQPQNQPVLLLRESDGDRYLPIWIGQSEAAAIALEQQGVEPARPLTHDLIRDLIAALGHSLREVRIVDLQEGTFYADLVFDRDITVSARPSDSVAIALRVGVPIYVEDAVMAEAGLLIPDESDEDGGAGGAVREDEVEKFKEFLDSISPDDFKAT
jgi:bifunctional DNase/RNase